MSDEARSRHKRVRTIKLTWVSQGVSRVITFAMQGIAIPTAYRALGEGGFAAYVAVTAASNLVWALNLGIGGALVTPVTEAAAHGDKQREALLVQAGLAPLVALCALGGIIALPAVSFMPLTTLFGRAGLMPPPDLRMAAVVSLAAILLSIAVSGVDAIRQAHLETHVSVLMAAAANLVSSVALLAAARLTHSLTVYVALVTVPPVVARCVNGAILFWKRPYLLRPCDVAEVNRCMKPLIGDGVRYLASSFAAALVYQWPIYWMTRHKAASESSAFAITVQLAILSVSIMVGMATPFWSSMADAAARGDFSWLRSHIRKARQAVLLAGSAIGVGIALFGERLVRIWIGKPVVLDRELRILIGFYVALAAWEGLNLTICFGIGRLRAGSMTVFLRSAVFAIAVPALTRSGAKAIWAGLCISILFWSAWRLFLVSRGAERGQELRSEQPFPAAAAPTPLMTVGLPDE